MRMLDETDVILNAKSGSHTNPRCESDVKATSVFASRSPIAANAPYKILSTASTSSAGAQLCAACGKSGSANASKPNNPALLCTPETIATSGAGAYVYACGIQLWNGNAGVLIRNAIANAPKIHHSSCAFRLNVAPANSKVCTWLTSAITPSSSTRPPAPL